jgi:Carbohydrate esterase 2 N-terminal
VEVRLCSLLICSLVMPAFAAAQQTGVKLVGRWLAPESAPTATYAGSTVLMSFKHSSSLSSDFKVSNSRGSQDLFVSVTVDGGKPVRIGLARGQHLGQVLASGLSAGPHLVAVRKEGEPYFGALQFSHPKLDVAGRWQTIVDDRPIIEVIGDSDATGICALGPDSPATAVSIYNSDWASQAASWVGLLDAGLAAVGHPVDMVDLAISGSKTETEAASYDYTAPGYSDDHFGDYSPPGRRHASVVFLWGGANDHPRKYIASGSPIGYANLSTFQKGVYDQLKRIFARNPDVKVVLLDYIDDTIPDWKPAYDQLQSLFSETERQRIFFLRVYDPKGKADACEIDPKGHPNLSMHATWAGQILKWMLSNDVLRQLGFPDSEQWNDQ